MRVYIETYGCWLNKAESAVMERVLRERGAFIVDDPGKADVVVVNTCAVRGDTERRMLRRIRELEEARRRLGFRLIVAGCLANVRPHTILELAPEASLVEPDALERIDEAVFSDKQVFLLRRYGRRRGVLPEYRGGGVYVVPIETGCLGACAFCVAGVARGRGVKSYDPDAIVEAVRSAVARGAREVYLTGQDVAAYGADIGVTLADLLGRLLDEVPGDYRIRLGMMEPMLLMRQLPGILGYFRDERLYRYFHVPVQSGSDKVLRLMHRRYTVSQYRGLVEAIRGEVGRASIVTDIIVGFPGEGEEEFNETLKLLKEVLFDKVHVARYTLRPFTPGYLMKGVPEPVKKKRSREASRVALEAAYRVNKGYVGLVKEVVVDSISMRGDYVGRTIEYKPVVLKEKNLRLGDVVEVKITGATPLALEGVVVS